MRLGHAIESRCKDRERRWPGGINTDIGEHPGYFTNRRRRFLVDEQRGGGRSEHPAIATSPSESQLSLPNNTAHSWIDSIGINGVEESLRCSQIALVHELAGTDCRHAWPWTDAPQSLDEIRRDTPTAGADGFHN